MREILMVHEKAVQDFWHRQYDPFRCQVAEEWQLLNATPVLACLPKHGGRLQLIVAFKPMFSIMTPGTVVCILKSEF